MEHPRTSSSGTPSSHFVHWNEGRMFSISLLPLRISRGAVRRAAVGRPSAVQRKQPRLSYHPSFSWRIPAGTHLRRTMEKVGSDRRCLCARCCLPRRCLSRRCLWAPCRPSLSALPMRSALPVRPVLSVSALSVGSTSPNALGAAHALGAACALGAFCPGAVCGLHVASRPRRCPCAQRCLCARCCLCQRCL
jgi:hypothetical protein